MDISSSIIGASLSEPHINGTAVREIYYYYYYVYYGICMVRRVRHNAVYTHVLIEWH